MKSDYVPGLSEGNRTYIVTLIFVGLLVFGPDLGAIQMRYFYLVGGPGAAWAILRLVGVRLDIDDEANDRIRRALSAALAGMFVMNSIDALNATEHLVCTREVGDGYSGKECIGDEVLVSGPDLAKASIFIAIAGVAFWSAVTRKTN